MIRRLLAPALVLLVLQVGVACERGPDDEMVVPEVTRTAAPETPQRLPDLPVGRAGLESTDRVEVGGAVIRVGRRTIDVSPMRVDAHVVTPGGIYFVNRGELWFTDLARITPTAFMKVRGLELTPDGEHLVFIDLEHGAPGEDGVPRALEVRYQARSGKALDSAYIEEPS